MKIYTGVYMLTNVKTNEVYIGAATDIKKRWSNHLSKMRRGTHQYDSFNDIDAVKFEILEECSVKDLKTREDYWMEYMKDLFKVVNKSRAGEIPLNSEEAKKVKSLAQMGSKNGNARLRVEDVLNIREMYEDEYTYNMLAEIFGVSPGHINAIIHRKKWKNI